jgi:predicted Zn-dependent protease
MKPLEPPDSFHLQAAQGWLELGSHTEANEELEKIAPELRAHPAVLEVRWEICAKAKEWDAALEIASALVQVVPAHPLGWLHRSSALHELKRTQEAVYNLQRVVDRFTGDAIIRYNLACYECQLGNLHEAMFWFQAACEIGDGNELKLMALEDPDLEPLWKDIGST